MTKESSTRWRPRSIFRHWVEKGRAPYQHVIKSRLFVRYLVSYVIVLAISVGITLVAYVFSVRAIQTEIVRAHYNSLTLLKNIVDARIMELEQIYVQIGFDERTRLFVGFPESDDPTMLLNTAKVIDNLQRYRLSNPLIEEIYIHSFRKDEVLTDVGKYGSDFFLEEVFPYPADVYRSLVPPARFGLSAFSSTGDEAGGITKIAYARPIPVERTTELTGMLVIVLDERQLVALMSALRWIDESVFFVVDDDHNILLENGASELEQVPRFETMGTGPEPYSVGERIVTSVASDRFPWNYVSVIPRRIFFRNAALVRNIFLLSILLLSIVGLGYSFLLARRHYSPVNKLIRSILDQTSGVVRKDQDEYHFIQSVLNTVLEERNEYLEGRSRQIRRLTNQFLLRILRGEVGAKAIQEMKDAYSIELDNNAAYCVVIQVIEGEQLPLSSETDLVEQMEEEHGATALLLIHAMERVLSPRFPVRYVDEGDTVVFIARMQPGNTEAQLNDAVKRGVSVVLDNLKTPVYTAVSGTHEGFAGLALAYREADETMEALLLTQNGKLLFSGNRKVSLPRGARYDFRNRLGQLSQAVTGKNFDAADVLVDAVCREFVEESSEQVSLIHYRMEEIAHTFINSVEDLMIYYHSLDYEYGALAASLPTCRSVAELKDRLHQALEEIRNYVEEKTGNGDNLQAQIIRYINNHFQDVNLNVSTVAHEFAVPVSHVSRLIKRTTGMGALEYLQLLRVTQAKRFLCEGDESLREIIRRVGFANEVSFIRVFKKIEGMTPGAYRKKERN